MSYFSVNFQSRAKLLLMKNQYHYFEFTNCAISTYSLIIPRSIIIDYTIFKSKKLLLMEKREI